MNVTYGKSIETFENATLVSVEQLDDTPSYEWDWRCKGTLYIGESQHKRPDKKDFRLTTGYGKIEQTEEYITITAKNSRYIFKI